MFKKISLLLAAFIFSSQLAFAEMLLFVEDECPHCEKLEIQLEAQGLLSTNDITRYEISQPENLQLYLEMSQQVGYTSGGVPLLIDGDQFVEGTTPILDYLGGETQIASQQTLSSDQSDELNGIIEEMIDKQDDQDPLAYNESSQASNSKSIVPYAVAFVSVLIIIALAYIYFYRIKAR